MSQLSTIQHLFALPQRDVRFIEPSTEFLDGILPKAGEILYITGPSGAGKSRLLRAVVQHLQKRGSAVLMPMHITWPDAPVIDCVDLPDLADRLQLLSHAGLAEAWTFVQRPSELSDGQRWRFVLALLLCRARRESRPVVIAMDEFASLLDRVTAAIVARSLRKLIDRGAFPCGVVVATAHDDLGKALRADRTIVCDFGKILL